MKNIVITILSILLIISVLYIYKANSEIDANKCNIEALQDSIHYYKSTNDELIASKLLFECDIKELKGLNEELSNEIKSFKVKKTDGGIQIKTVYSNDTTYIPIDTTKSFELKDKYRWIKGEVSDSLVLTKDEVYATFTSIVKDNKVYIKSNNPYIQYNEIVGYIEPKKAKRLSLGLSFGLGLNYGLVNKKVDVGPYVGVGLNVKLF